MMFFFISISGVLHSVVNPPTMGFVLALGLLVFRVFASANLKSGLFKNRG